MLKGENILLRPLKATDLDFLFTIENDTSNWQFGSEKKQYTKTEFLEYIANANTSIELAKQYRFVIDKNQKPIGFIDLFDYKNNTAGVGIIIAKNYRKQGFAKDALKVLIDYAFSEIKITKLHCEITNDNLASIKLFTSCGFEMEREENGLRYFIRFVEKKK
ncbi:MAG: GNAT family N-acetyltransferase [Flavobacteriales bacterium]|nr:GNAT family N-acetyltransferase [Flavobacteriales bacterium]